MKILFALHWIVIVAKSYKTDEEEQRRFDKFSKNFAHILEHNSEEALGMHSFTLGLNKYSDMVRTIVWMCVA